MVTKIENPWCPWFKAHQTIVRLMTIVNHGHKGGTFMLTIFDHALKHIQLWLD